MLKFKFKDLKINNYHHGGSRVYFEGKHTRELICDTYGDIENPHDMELREKIHEVIRNYYKNKLKI